MEQPSAISGFTLIELIAVILLMGLLVLGGTSFMTYGVRGFTLVGTHVDFLQKSGLAMERLIREMENMDRVYQAGAAGVRFRRDGDDYGIALAGNEIRIIRSNALPGDGQGAVLADNITAFSLNFQDPSNSTWTPDANNSLRELARVEISFTMTIEGLSRQFDMVVNPTYTDMLNGPAS